MADLRDQIAQHYESGMDEDARLRSGIGRLELERVREIVRRSLPAAPARVLDVGGATGVHAEWLLADGHEVHLVDLLDSHVARAREQLGGEAGFSAQVADARALPVADGAYDVVLLLGPLYHLQKAADRVAAWGEAVRAVRPGGAVIGMAISRFASVFDGLAWGALFDPRFRSIVETDLVTGRHENPERTPHWFTTAYFQRPDELAEEAAAAGLEGVEVLGVEGIAGWMRNLGPRMDDDAGRETLLWSARAVESEPSVLGLSPHLLAVGRRPVG